MTVLKNAVPPVDRRQKRGRTRRRSALRVGATRRRAGAARFRHRLPTPLGNHILDTFLNWS